MRQPPHANEAERARARWALGASVGAALVLAGGCGAVLGLDDLSPGQATTSTGAGGGSACAELCNTLFDCGMAECASGWTEADRSPYLEGCDGAEGCVASCEPLYDQLATVVDASDCASTVSILGTYDATFKDACDNGIEACAGGGAGGAAGAGGAGGG